LAQRCARGWRLPTIYNAREAVDAGGLMDASPV